MRAFLTRIAPLTNAARIRKPLFVAHGTNDPRVPVTESKQIVAAVRQDGGTVWYLEATNEGHGIGRRSNLNYLIDAWAYFMQEFLIK
jgi:dipeptidyl aminopeptidase/acylaminoacyl peptidase